MKNAIAITLCVLAVIAATRILIPPQPLSTPTGGSQAEHPVFEHAVKIAHWISNAPKHSSIFAAPPVNVVVDADVGITEQSSISINKNGQEYGRGDTAIDANKKTMRRKMDAAAPDGLYSVRYRACWTEGNCENGSFQFAIDRRLAGNFEDHVGRPDIPPDIGISIENNAFVPKMIRIRKHTRVIWTNNDTVDHSVNTDTYPSNSYFPKQNSIALKPKEAFEVVFSEVGEYPYHDNSPGDKMIGSILVEE